MTAKASAVCRICGAPFSYRPRRQEPRRECGSCNAERRIDGTWPVTRKQPGEAVIAERRQRAAIVGIIRGWWLNGG